MTIKQRVRAGIRFLDKVYGKKWRKKIRLGKLDLSSIQDCVLAQTDSNFILHKMKLGLSEDDTVRLGFEVSNSEAYEESYEDLTAKWKEAFTEEKRKRRI